METAEQVGFIQFWGHSSHFNCLQNLNPTEEINILLSATSDLRHILKTCASNSDKNYQINFYIHEKQKEVVCRSLLLLLILHTSNLNYRERTDLFLEIYGNSLIREKSQEIIAISYINKVIPYIDDLICKSTKHTSALNKIIDLKELKFKDRDEMVDIIKSWHSSIPFQIEKLRDQRLRYIYKTRYDFRKNLVDWDYQMQLKDFAPIIHFYHYREWRESGIAFESRFSTYPTPNRTLSSYLPGKKKQTHESCLVRGFWGDIVVSPYIGFGIWTDIMPEKEMLFKVSNRQQVSHSIAVTEFNVYYLLQKLDSQTEYHIQLDSDQPKQNDKKTEKVDEKKELEKIEEEEEQNKEQEEEQKQQDQQNKKIEEEKKESKKQIQQNKENEKSVETLQIEKKEDAIEIMQIKQTDFEDKKAEELSTQENTEIQDISKSQILEKECEDQKQQKQEIENKQQTNDNQKVEVEELQPQKEQKDQLLKIVEKIEDEKLKEIKEIQIKKSENSNEQLDQQVKQLETIENKQKQLVSDEEIEIPESKPLQKQLHEEAKDSKKDEEEIEIPESKPLKKQQHEEANETKKIEDQQKNKKNEEEIEIPESKHPNEQKQTEQQQSQNYDNIQISQDPLLVFSNLKLKIIPIFEDIEKIILRKKFQQFFDVAVIGFYNSAYVKNKDLKNILKPSAYLYAENAKFMVPLKVEDRKLAFDNIVKFAQEDGGFIRGDNIDDGDHIFFKKK